MNFKASKTRLTEAYSSFRAASERFQFINQINHFFRSAPNKIETEQSLLRIFSRRCLGFIDIAAAVAIFQALKELIF